MKNLRSLYLLYGLLVCVTLAVANHRGWSVLYAALPHAWNPSTPGSYHK